MALVGGTEDVMSVSILDFRCEVTFPTVLAKNMLARHHDWMVPICYSVQANLALKFVSKNDVFVGN